MLSTAYNSANRFTALRTDSPDRPAEKQGRNRSVSVKRNHKGDPSNSSNPDANNTQNVNASTENAGTGNPHPSEAVITLDAEVVKNVRDALNKTAKLVEVAEREVIENDKTVPPEIKSIFAHLIEAIKGLGHIQETLVNNAKAAPPTPPSYAEAAAKGAKQKQQAKKPRSEQAPGQGNPQAKGNVGQKATQANPPPPAQDADMSEEDRKYYRFKEHIKEAERSTLVFNLNLGKFPIMNTETMAKKPTLALSTMAAKAEGITGSIPSEEALVTIDDALDMVKSVKFYGRQTKSYRNSKDPLSGSFCTVPVRYEFKDRNTRIMVEEVLKERCKVSCNTPYPTVLRECIKQTVEKMKKTYPGSKVKVSVDAHNFCLRAAKKGKDDPDWVPIRRHLGLPLEALEIFAKRVPRDFSFDPDLSPSPPRNSRKETHEQEILQENEQEPAANDEKMDSEKHEES